MKNNYFLVIFFLILFFVSPTYAIANEPIPPNWPWRGVSINLAGIKVNDENISYLANHNVNAIEIIISPRLYALRNKISGEEALQQEIETTDNILKQCKKYNITCVISISQIPIEPKSNLTQESPEFWDNPDKTKEVIKISEILAQHFYKSGPELGAYQIISEPVKRTGNIVESPKTWPQWQNNIINEIRKYDKTRFIIVTQAMEECLLVILTTNPIVIRT